MSEVTASACSVQFDAVVKKFGDGPTVLQDINFIANDGDFVAIIGPSGCGKSTLLRLLAGLVPITAGQVKIDGAAPGPESPELAYVFQEPTLLAWQRVAANVELPLVLRKVPANERAAIVHRCLSQVRLSDRADAFPRQLSGGQQMRVSIARALAIELLGIGELLDCVQGYRYSDESFHALAELAREYDVPFNLHVTDPKLDTKSGMQPTPLNDFVDLANALPDNTFILAHLGGGLPWSDISQLPTNLYFDTAAVPLIYHTDAYRRAVAAVGSDRILFGSDYPLRLHPRDSKHPAIDRIVSEIQSAGLAEDELSAMMGRNLQRLLPRV